MIGSKSGAPRPIGRSSLDIGGVVSLRIVQAGRPGRLDLANLHVGPVAARPRDRVCGDLVTRDSAYSASFSWDVVHETDRLMRAPGLRFEDDDHLRAKAIYGAESALLRGFVKRDCDRPAFEAIVAFGLLRGDDAGQELEVLLDVKRAAPYLMLLTPAAAAERDGKGAVLDCKSDRSEISSHLCRLSLAEVRGGDYVLRVLHYRHKSKATPNWDMRLRLPGRRP